MCYPYRDNAIFFVKKERENRSMLQTGRSCQKDNKNRIKYGKIVVVGISVYIYIYMCKAEDNYGETKAATSIVFSCKHSKQYPIP